MDDYRYFVGDGARNLLLRALPESYRAAPTVEALLEEFRADYARNWRVKTRPYPGIPEMLRALQAKRIGMAVLSNKPDEETRKCVSALLPKWRFDLVRGHLDGVPLKPDPSSALSVAKELGIAPSSFLYLGDTNVDMQTAVGAGMYPVGALWGFRTREELIESGAKALVAHPMELLQLLE